ncbi:hypothetical protein HYV86_02015 [Candidatus Woesearchaeota archaeon]|nr:hypothetical protein [Candidatus Woesearchaeota archaeon]
MFDKKRRYVLPALGTKGQVTIFIIVGILLLFGFGAVWYFTSSTGQAELEVEETILVSSTPQAFEPISLYTESCMRQVAERGVRILGEQGGYIYPDLVGEFSSTNPTEFDGLSLESVKIPYWHYNAAPNADSKISLASLRPALFDEQDDRMSVEAQVRRYVSEQLDDCLQDYEPFVSQGFEIVDKQSPIPTVMVRENDVVVNVEMPLRLRKGESEGDFKQFVVTLPVPLKKYYDLANNISITEQQHPFLENIALNLLQVYSGLDQNKIPPTSATAFDDEMVIWQTSKVKEQFKQILSSNVNNIRFLDADNFERYQYEPSTRSGLYQRTSDDMILPLTGAKGLEVRFDYFDWDIYLDINEGQQMVQPAGYKFSNPLGLIPFNLQFKNYYNTYDISYPVLVTIRDEDAFEGRGYNFAFSLEGTIVNNRPAYLNQVEAPLVSRKASLACNPQQRNTQLLRSIVVDASTGNPLDAVQIGFQIPDQDYCYMGSTDSEGELEVNYPAVYGGIVDFTLEGYLTNYYPIDTYSYKKKTGVIGYAVGPESAPVVELYPYKEINISIKQKPLVKCIGSRCPSLQPFGFSGDPLISYKPDFVRSRHSWVFPGATRTLTDAQTATIILTRIGDLYNEVSQDDFTTVASVTGSEVSAIRLVPGVYKVDGVVTTNQMITIPEEERCDDGFTEKIFCGDLDGCCFTLDSMQLKEFQIGSIRWDEQSTYLTITPDQLYGSKQVNFYISTYDLGGVEERDRIMEDLNVINELNNVSIILRRDLEPVFR